MLILTRRVGETIVIGETIRVTVLKTKGHHVQLGIDAPKEVNIKREESPPHRMQTLGKVAQ
jgi:carbon storage regulator